ncbi:uncharacterized protein LAESUDRAFT_667889, partial [Laetiporus sulphureus 93-53]
MVDVCAGCLTELKDERRNGQPAKWSMANNMWLGSIPWQLAKLTLPEQQLIALLYPRVFTVKLYPKNPCIPIRNESLQSALKGNVCTFTLKNSRIVDMLAGNLMPRPPAVLAHLISITFIGKGQLQKHHLHNTYRMRRSAIVDALRWLKVYNRYYRDIEIDQARVQSLLEDDVPEEL